MSQLVKGFFGKDGSKAKAEQSADNDQNSDESDGMFRDLEDRTFEPMEATSEKRSSQVIFLLKYFQRHHLRPDSSRLCNFHLQHTGYNIQFLFYRWTATSLMPLKMTLTRRT